jgi:hypothetical protein
MFSLKGSQILQIVLFSALLFISGLVFSADALSADNMFFAGLTFSHHGRQAAYTLSDKSVQYLNREPLKTLGISAGKRISLPLHLRLHLPLFIDYGVVNDDTLDINSDLSYVLKSSFFHVGLAPQLQFPFKVSPDAAFYLSVGGGVHGMKNDELEHKLEDPDVRVTDPYLQHNFTWSPSFDAGAGFEIIIRKQYAIAFQYSFRYWKPVHYDAVRDLFPSQGMDYKEEFITHSLQILFLAYRYRN